MSYFKERLLEAEFQLYDAISDPEDIRAFKQLWSTLSQDVQCAISCNAIDAATISQYHATSNLVQELSQSMMKFYEEVEVIDTAFQQDLDDIFARWEKSGAFPNALIEAPSTRRDVSLAARWLSQNYFNPYPPNTVRDDISRRANWNRKDIDAWFTEARKRIGWNDVRKQYFGNRRAETIEKVTQFFNGPHMSLEPTLEQALMDLKSRVREFYVDPFTPSELAASLDKARSHKTLPGVYKEEISPMTTPRYASARSIPSNPQPLSSISRSVSPIGPTRKRRRNDLPGEDDTDVENRPKRARLENSLAKTTLQTQLLSPAASQPDLAEISPRVVPTEPSNPNAKRKRSLSPVLLPDHKRRRNSTPQIQDRRKYPSNGSRATGLQAVSAPSLPSMFSQPIYSDIASVLLQPTVGSNLYSNPLSTPPPSSSSCPTTPNTLVPGAQAHLVHPLLQTELPQFSYELPSPATCDQPAVQAVDLSLFHTTNLHDLRLCTQDFNANSSTIASTLMGDVVHDHSAEGADFTSISGFPGNPSDDQDLLNLFPLPFNHGPVSDSSPPTNMLNGADASFNPLFDLDAAVSQQPLHLDDMFFANFFEDISMPSVPTPVDTENAKEMACLQAWKKHESRVQEYIKSLEGRIAAKACA